MEKGGVGQAVILKNNRLFNLLEHPVNTAGHSPLAAQIHLGEVGQHLAIPIHALNDGTGGNDLLGFSRAICPRAIAHDQQLGWLGLGDFRKNPFGNVRPVEDNKSDRSGDLKIRHETDS